MAIPTASEPLLTLEGPKLAFAARTLKLIASPAKLAILLHLYRHGETSVNDLAEAVGLPQPLLSHHLANLKAGFVVDARRNGKQVLYRLRLLEVVHVLECMGRCQIPEGFDLQLDPAD